MSFVCVIPHPEEAQWTNTFRKG